MNLEDYISSGIIESYVLGLASAEEVDEVRRLSRFSEVAEAINYVEIKFEMLGLQNSITPPGDAWMKIKQNMDELRIKETRYHREKVSSEKAQRVNPFTVINLQNSKDQIFVHKYWRPAFIAVFILAKIFLISALYYYFKTDSLLKENATLKQQVELIKK